MVTAWASNDFESADHTDGMFYPHVWPGNSITGDHSTRGVSLPFAWYNLDNTFRSRSSPDLIWGPTRSSRYPTTTARRRPARRRRRAWRRWSWLRARTQPPPMGSAVNARRGEAGGSFDRSLRWLIPSASRASRELPGQTSTFSTATGGPTSWPRMTPWRRDAFPRRSTSARPIGTSGSTPPSSRSCTSLPMWLPAGKRAGVTHIGCSLGSVPSRWRPPSTPLPRDPARAPRTWPATWTLPTIPISWRASGPASTRPRLIVSRLSVTTSPSGSRSSPAATTRQPGRRAKTGARFISVMTLPRRRASLSGWDPRASLRRRWLTSKVVGGSTLSLGPLTVPSMRSGPTAPRRRGSRFAPALSQGWTHRMRPTTLAPLPGSRATTFRAHTTAPCHRWPWETCAMTAPSRS